MVVFMTRYNVLGAKSMLVNSLIFSTVLTLTVISSVVPYLFTRLYCCRSSLKTCMICTRNGCLAHSLPIFRPQ